MTFDKFVIRTISLEDAENYFTFIEHNRDRLSLYFASTVEQTRSVESTQEYIKKRIERAANKDFITYVIVDTESKKIIGSIFLRRIDWKLSKTEMVSFIDVAYEGKGVVVKALSMLIDHCFWSLGLNKVFFRIPPDNLRSIRIAERLNFTKEGVLRSDFKNSNGEFQDVVYFGLLKSDKRDRN